MRILFLTNEIPFPPDNGIKIVPYNAMRLMHERGHTVCLCTLTAEQRESNTKLNERFNSLSEIISPESWWMKTTKRSRLAQISDTLNGKLTFIQQFKNKDFEAKFINTLILFKPDVVHFDYINMTQYIDCLPHSIGSIASINDCHTLSLYNNLASGAFTGFAKLVKKIQYIHTRRYEIECYAKFNYTHLMTDVDSDFLQQMDSSIKTCVISNGVDSELFSINDTEVTNSDIIFVGKLTGNNLFSLKQFIEYGWPYIKNHPSNPTLKVAGKVTKEAQQWITDITENETKIEFIGYQSQLKAAYDNRAIAIVPIDKNSGILNKAIEAMAANVAVVGFSSAFEGISLAKPDVHYLGGNSYADLGRCTQQLLDNPGQRLIISKNGRALSMRHYNWPSKGTEYEAMYHSAKQLAKG